MNDKALENIVTTIQSNANFSMLSKAMETAEVIDKFSGEGPFTFFAPTNEAFKFTFPEEKLEDLLENKEKMVKLLEHHVIADKLMAEDFEDLDEVEVIAGEKLKVDTRRGIKVSEAKVEDEDIEASNGVIHAIDKCILPGTKEDEE